LVEIQHVGYVSMSQLNIGDYVMSGDDKFTQVCGFGHFDPIHAGTFLHITFHDDANGESVLIFPKQESILPSSFIEISERHLIMIERNHKQYRLPAKEVRVDDILSGQRVKSMHEVIRRGVYAPLTQSGDIRVNGIVASNYVDLLEFPSMTFLPDQHTLAHVLFYHQRLFCYSFIELCKKEIYIHGYSPLAYLLVGGSAFLHNFGAMNPMPIFWFFILLLLCWLIVVLVQGMTT
jgi:Hint module